MRLAAFVLPAFGDKKVSELEANEIRKWHREIAKTPARTRTKTGAEQAYRRDNLQEPETQRKRQAAANRCLGLLKAALNLAWREKKVESNDAWQRVELFGGVDIRLMRRLFLTLDGRYVWASGDLGRSWVDFDPIDLSGFRMAAGINIVFEEAR